MARTLAPVAMVVLAVWLSWGILTTGLAGRFESMGQGDRALQWRARSPVALTQAALASERKGDYPAAAATARRAISQAPLEAGPMQILASATDALGHRRDAEVLMRQTVKLSLRDAQAQAWLLNQAMARQNYEAASLHADVLLRRSDEAVGSMTWLLMQIANSPEGRSALARRLSEDPPWRNRFLLTAARNGSVADMGALFGALAKTDQPPTDDELSPFFLRLASMGRYEDARRYWAAVARGRPVSLSQIFDGGFEGLGAPAPFNWQILRVAGGDAALLGPDKSPLGYARLRHDGFSSSSVMMRQLLFLPAGRYTLRATVQVDEPDASGRFRMELACFIGGRLGRLPLEGDVGKATVSSIAFEVPEGCGAQWLVLWPTSVDRRDPVEMRIDDVEIRPALDSEFTEARR